MKTVAAWAVLEGCDYMAINCNDCKYSELLLGEEPCSECFGYSAWEQKQNPYWERISSIADRQRAKGMSKYGVGLENNTANATERVRHIQEELIDALMYLTWLEESLKEGEADDQD